MGRGLTTYNFLVDAAGAKKMKKKAPQAPKKMKMGRRRRRKVWGLVVYGAEGAGKNWILTPPKAEISEEKTRRHNLQGGGVYSPLAESCTTYKGRGL